MKRLFSTTLQFLLVASVLTAGSPRAASARARTAPVAASFSTTVPANRQNLIRLQGSDAEGTSLTYATTSRPAHGALSALDAATGYVVYTPTVGFTGSDSFTYTVASGGETSPSGTVTIVVTNAKTTVTDTITDASGNPRSGKVTFILTQAVTSPAGVTPVGTSVTAALNSSGTFSVQLYPSRSLNPAAYYQVWFNDSVTLKAELLGVYDIPAATTAVSLSTYKVTDTNIAARYTFASAAGVDHLTSADKCEQACNPKAYGAVGDGAVDDSVAFQAVLNAVRWIRGGSVNVPEGRYKITTPIVLPRVQQFGVYSTVNIYAYGAVFEPTSAASSVFYYHPPTQVVNDNVIYNSVRIFGAQFKAATRTAGQTGIDISACEGCRFQDLDFVNMNGIHGRTFYRTSIDSCNVHIDNEFGFKIESGDWIGATPTNSPSNGTVIRNSRVIPGSGSRVSYWFINSDLSGVEGPSIHDAPDALYPGSGSPQYEIYFDNTAYPYGQTNFVRDYYSERPSLPTGAVIGAALHNGTLTLDLVRRYDDATGVVYVDATASTPDSTIMLRAWPRIDASPTPRFKTASGVQWMFDHVGEAGSRNFLNSAWWVGGTVGAVSQWGLNGIVVSGGGSSGTTMPFKPHCRYGSSAEASFGISRGPNFFLLGSNSGDILLRATDRTKRLILGVGDGTGANDKAVLTIDSNASGAGNTGILILENGVPRRVSVGSADSCGTGYRCLRIPN
jgi:hypothetical protein